ncbi:unnamed protein product [Closterium sp. NIES-54]
MRRRWGWISAQLGETGPVTYHPPVSVCLAVTNLVLSSSSSTVAGPVSPGVEVEAVGSACRRRSLSEAGRSRSISSGCDQVGALVGVSFSRRVPFGVACRALCRDVKYEDSIIDNFFPDVVAGGGGHGESAVVFPS